MVDISSKLDGICSLIEQGKYFTINQARQYGKTTTMELLRRSLEKQYVVLSLSFEEFGKETFANENQFVRDFLEIQLFPELELQKEDLNIFMEQNRKILTDKNEKFNLAKLSRIFTELCKTLDKPIVMMIDEVDSACNNQVFIDFLAVLRAGYMKRSRMKAFQSVILAGVYDVKNVKVKLEPDHEKHNSPWNIAADFDVDLGFSVEDIQTMLQDYMVEQHKKMDVISLAKLIFAYTSGYPYLVSYVCKKMDKEQLEWNGENIQKVIYEMPKETNPLFDDIIKKLEQHEGFRKMVERILLVGEEITFVRSNPDIDLGVVFGIFKNREQKVCISNEIFEMFIYEYMISMRRNRDDRLSNYSDTSLYVQNGKLDMDLVVRRFADFIKAEYREEDQAFIEQQGRLLFLCFIRPIINGTGHYAVEAQTRKNKRMDVQIFYGNEEFIVELKCWRGMKYEKEGYDQLAGYLDARGKEKGYMISFCRNKERPAEDRVFMYKAKEIVETIVMY